MSMKHKYQIPIPIYCPKTYLMCLGIVGKIYIVILWRKRIKEKTGLGKLVGALD